MQPGISALIWVKIVKIWTHQVLFHLMCPRIVKIWTYSFSKLSVSVDTLCPKCSPTRAPFGCYRSCQGQILIWSAEPRWIKINVDIVPKSLKIDSDS